MLKIGSIRWRGKCGRHPAFDPEDGEGAIRGGCERCLALLEISRTHQKLVSQIRAFGPPKPEKPKPAGDDSRQTSLFDIVE